MPPSQRPVRPTKARPPWELVPVQLAGTNLLPRLTGALVTVTTRHLIGAVLTGSGSGWGGASATASGNSSAAAVERRLASFIVGWPRLPTQGGQRMLRGQGFGLVLALLLLRLLLVRVSLKVVLVVFIGVGLSVGRTPDEGLPIQGAVC